MDNHRPNIDPNDIEKIMGALDGVKNLRQRLIPPEVFADLTDEQKDIVNDFDKTKGQVKNASEALQRRLNYLNKRR